MRRRNVWSTGVPMDRSKARAFTDIIRAPEDPERSPRVAASDPRSDTMALWRRELKKSSPADWEARILEHLSDGMARTFNRIAVELLDKTADIVMDTPIHVALWNLVEAFEVEHTMHAIYFRRSTIVFVEFDDKGPDGMGRRHFTAMWFDREWPRERGQCFHMRPNEFEKRETERGHRVVVRVKVARERRRGA